MLVAREGDAGPEGPEERSGAAGATEIAARAGAPVAGRRRRKLFGCLAIAVIFLAASAWIVLRDDPPPDDADLILPPEPDVPHAQTVIGGIDEILAELPEFPGVAVAYYDLDTGAFRSFDDGNWDSATIHALEEHAHGVREALERIDEVLQRESLGWCSLEDQESALFFAPRNLHHHLVALAQWHRARREFSAASLVLERGLLLWERLGGEETRRSIAAIMAWMSLRQVLDELGRLLEDGDADLGVEVRTLRRLPTMLRNPDATRQCLIGEYRLLRQQVGTPGFIDESLAPPLMLARESPWLRPFFKENRTLARCAEITRDCLAQIDRPPLRRELPEELTWSIDRMRRSAVLRLNSGELLLDVILHADWLLVTSDATRLEEIVLRILLALRRYERTHGTLPPDLEELRRGVTELATPIVDPYSGEPLLYDPARRIFWSVGPNGIDDGAEGWSLPGRGREEFADRVWHVPPLPGESR